MKRVLLALLLVLVLSGCSKTTPKPECLLLEHASPDTSAMAFYYFDGDQSQIRWLFDQKEEKKIIQEINALPTKAVDADRVKDMTIPTYGIEICDEDGYEIWLTYSQGLWLTKDGSVYEATYDMASLFEQIPTDSSDIWDGVHVPNAAILGKYDIRYYEKVTDMTDTIDGVTLAVTDVKDAIVTVTLTNDSDEAFGYGEYFSLQKELDGEWYTLPPALSNYGFSDLGYILDPHQSAEETCDLTMYGDLEPGPYRIAKEGMAAEFVIE